MKRLLIFFLALFLSTSFYSAVAQTTSSGEMEGMAGFARAVAVSDGTVFIGEAANPHQPGLVYAYQRAEGKWSEQFEFSASDGEIGDAFGASLTVDGDAILIGAPARDDDRGAAYLFTKSADGSWSQAAQLAVTDTSKKGRLGTSVALSGDVAFLGAPGEMDGHGAVYVFRKTESGSWTRQQRLANPDTAQGIGFGSALDVDGSKLLVGAPEEGGAVHVYRSGDEGSWEKEATLGSDQVADNARFGSTLGVFSDKVLVGAPRDASGAGAVFVYERNADGSWMASGKLVAFDGQPRYGFGSSLAIAEGKLWVGTPGADDRKGALYQFEQNKDSGEWVGVSKIGGPDRKQGDQFASTVAADEDVAVAGLTGADYGAGTAAILEMDNTGSWSVATTVVSESSSVLEPITGNRMNCSDGTASHFGCSNVNLLSFLPIQEIGGDRGVQMNDIWGWTDPKTGKEYALAGRINGTSFVDISDPTNPVYVANLPMTEGARANAWRDIKVYKNHAYVVADNAGEHGIQVVDLTKLRDFNGSPMTLEEDAIYDKVHSVHNIVINEDTGYAYAVGSSGGGQTCGGGLHMVNIQDPKNPTFAGCFADPSTGRSGTGYTHDAQCVTYHGPDKEYQGEEICVGANETAISIANVSDKENPKALSTASYPDYAYVHQGWFTEDQRYFFQNDELDELTGNVDRTRTLIWDLSDLDDPQFVDEYYFDNASSDHNLYIKGNTMYQSNYVSGLQVVDISNPEKPKKIGYFDTEPFGEDKPGFAGTWSNYPYFESDIIIMTSSTEGLFILENADQPVSPASAQ